MPIRTTHHCFVVPSDVLDAAESALDAFAEGGDDIAPLHALLDRLWHDALTTQWTTTSVPDPDAWRATRAQVAAVGPDLGVRREVVTSRFEAVGRLAARWQRLAELEGPQVIIDREEELLRSTLSALDTPSVPQRGPTIRLDRIARMDGDDIVDLGQWAEHLARCLALTYDDVGTGEVDADATELEALAALDDWWVIHRQRFFESDVSAWRLAPSTLTQAPCVLDRPFLSLETRHSPSCRAWSVAHTSLPAGEFGGPLTRSGRTPPSWAPAPAVGQALVSLVWVETENGHPLRQ